MKSAFCTASAAALVSVSLSGCGTITQGTTQNIAINTSPPGAQCDLDRSDGHIATVYRTPGVVHVDKSKNDIMLTCSKRGYEPASVVLDSDYSLGLFGNVIIGGLLGIGIDLASGAAHQYPSTAAMQIIPSKDNSSPKGDPASLVQVAARPPCTPEDLELARAAEEAHFRVRLVCD